MSAIRKGDWKIVENQVSGEFYLYNLNYDINEMTNLKFSHPEKMKEMKSSLKDWQIRTNAKRPVINPNFDARKRYEWSRNPYRK